MGAAAGVPGVGRAMPAGRGMPMPPMPPMPPGALPPRVPMPPNVMMGGRGGKYIFYFKKFSFY
jgi:hypothetical protein